MRKRDKTALTVAPLLLRLALGVIFLWAGLGKVAVKTTFEGEQAAALANAGVISPSGASPQPFGEPEVSPEGEDAGGVSLGDADHAVVPAVLQTSSETYTAADFPEGEGHEGPRVLGLVVTMYNASHPGYDEDSGEARPATWPKSLGTGQPALLLAWLVAISEILCGAGLLVGLLTRLAGLGVSGVMVGAMWLDQIGPAIQSGTTQLGFLPGYETFSMEWISPLFQFSLLCAGLAVALLGAGPVSLDALFFRPKRSGGDEGDEGDHDDED